MLFQSKVRSNPLISDIIRKYSGVVSKRSLIENIFSQTGVLVCKSTIYEEQRRLKVI